MELLPCLRYAIAAGVGIDVLLAGDGGAASCACCCCWRCAISCLSSAGTSCAITVALPSTLPHDAELDVPEPHLLPGLDRVWIVAEVIAVDPRAVRRAEVVDEQLTTTLDVDLGVTPRQRRIAERQLARRRIASRVHARGQSFELGLRRPQLQPDRHDRNLTQNRVRWLCRWAAGRINLVSPTQTP